MTSSSLLRRAALAKSLTSSEAFIESIVTMRCRSAGKVATENSAFLNFSRASAHLPWRAKARPFHSCES